MIAPNSRRRILTALGILCLLVPLSYRTATPVHAGSACPAVGSDTDCGALITVTDSGATVTMTGQGPYDGVEDTLVGVVNNSSEPIQALGLTSGMAVFGFDGDGIDRYSVPGNGRDGTGYGGPNAYFSDIAPDQMSGTVNFITPLSAHGGTTYFSLEESIASAVSCKSLIDKALDGPLLSPMKTRIAARFRPNMGYTLDQAAKLCGFKNFNWQQVILMLPRPSPYKSKKTGEELFTSPKRPFIYDPPPGGYDFDNNDSYPYYYDQDLPASNRKSVFNHVLDDGHLLYFSDAPADMCLPGGNGEGCDGKTAPKGSFLKFKTDLVGVQQDGKPKNLGINFTWTDTWNGSAGGISVLTYDGDVDPGSGTGEVTITAVNDVTDYQFQGIGVTTVNGMPIGSLDLTPPVITPSITGTRGRDGWYVSDVGVQWNVVDAESAVTTTSGCDPATVSVDTPSLTFTCTATSAGGTSSQSVAIKRDATPPLIIYGAHPSSYTIDQQVSIGCLASDNLSGVVSSTCRNVSGPAWSFGPGSHMFAATAVDDAGNTGTGSIRFAVVSTFASQCALTRAFDTTPTQAAGMCTVLGYAQAAASRGDTTLKMTYLTNYLRLVNVAVAESYLRKDQATVLTIFANTL